MQIFNQNNLERNLLNKEEHFQNPYAIFRDGRAGIFNYALRLFALIVTTLLFNTMSAEPLLSKEDYYRKYSYEPARPTTYEPEGKSDHQSVEYNHGGSDYQNAKYYYGSSDHYLIGYLYYLWYWIWCNIVLILIIAIIVWLIVRWYYRSRIDAEFRAVAASVPPGGEVSVGNVGFMLNTLRNSLPV